MNIATISLDVAKNVFQVNWWIAVLAVVLWIVGLALGRKRHLSRGALITFTIVMLGSLVLDFVTSKGKLPGLWALGGGGVGIILLAALFVGLGLYKKKFLVTYLLMAVALLLILSTFLFNTGYFATYSIFALVFLLLLTSWIITFRKRNSSH